MQEPSSLRDQNSNELSRLFPIGIVIKQEAEAPRRVQVRIPALHTEIEDDDLPFFRVGLPVDGSGQDGRSGKFVTLKPGTEVQCILYDPRGYSGAILCMFANTKNDIGGDDLYGYRDDAGNSFRVNPEGDMTLQGAGGALVEMTKANKIRVVASELELSIGDLNITTEMLTVLATTFNTTANDWTVSATSPVITDGAGGGGGSGSAPSLTPPELPDRPDVAGKKDM